MVTRTKPLDGVTLPTLCPVCRGRLRWHGAPAELRCDDCALGPVTLSPADAWEIVKYLSMPSVQKVPLETFVVAVLATHHIYAVVAHPDPRAVYTREHKWRVLPREGETFAERAARLSEQAALNGVQVWPLQWDDWGDGDAETLISWDGRGVPTLFAATSQRRKADGSPICTYAPVEVSPFRAECPCDASGLCTHLRAVADWLQAWNESEREKERERAAGPSLREAVAEMWG